MKKMMITAALSKLIRKVFLTKKRLKDPRNLLSPSPSHFLCEICFDWHPLSKSLNPKDCSHFYCFNCIIKYVSSKLDHNITNIRCPESGCKGLLDDPDDYRSVLPKKLFDRWGMALCESAIEIPKKFYCPYVNCSVLLINDGKCKIQKFMCPNCKRLFCVKCKAPWHTEFSCAKYQVIAKKGNDTLMEELSKKKGWMKCPKCSIFVEKNNGCMHMKCRCGKYFCYMCGSSSSNHDECNCPRTIRRINYDRFRRLNL